MRCHMAQYRPFPAKVLHELAREFNSVPLHTTDARDITFIDLREHVVQTMTAFVEKGDHIVVGQERGFATRAFCKIADQMRDRGLQLLGIGSEPACSDIVHPSATTFSIASARVEIKLTNQRSRAFNSIKLNALMPDRCCVFADTDFKQRFDNFEQASHDFGGGEIHLHLLFAKSVTRFFQFFTDIRPVPSLWIFQIQLL